MPTEIPAVHPEHAVAYSLVLHPSDEPNHQPVYSLGALEVILKSGTDLGFKRHHWVYSAQIVSNPHHDLFALVHAQTYLISANAPHVVSDHRDRLSDDRFHCELAGLGSISQPSHIRQIVDARQRVLASFAGDFGIDLALPNATLVEQARLAPNRAQAIWLTWAFGCLRNDPDYGAILAGFQAWRALDNQRVVSW